MAEKDQTYGNREGKRERIGRKGRKERKKKAKKKVIYMKH